ncbi:MAG TPA: DUF1501 domain-containing protein [Verrucomicrobiae bacterium]|nr:DUF1501 domain-containing protein [Verrucomicrobiae bacterium]
MNRAIPHVLPATSRRDFSTRTGFGFGALAAGCMLGADGFKSGAANVPIDPLNPLTPRLPHHAPKAQSVIFLFMEGGPSHIDLFDPKPALDSLAGKPMPDSYGRPITAMGTASNSILPSKRKFKQHGESGIWVSDWLPNIAEQVDDIAVLRSCWANGLNHVGSVCQMNTGDILAGRPSLGAWSTYGLGAANQNLPTFVVMSDGADPLGGTKNWSSGFLPASFQGTVFRAGDLPIFDLAPPPTVGARQQRSKLDFLTPLNRQFGAGKEEDTELAARLNSYELAYRMQSAAPEAVDLSQETEATRRLYGLDETETEKFGKLCLMARRLVERGVRFVELYCGSGSAWDAHVDIEENHSKRCKASDKPVAGLLKDLKARGLLENTLVVWGGEFGRTPFNEKGKGRDHNPWGFSMWFAGGGIKPGTVVGSTDELGLRAVEDKAHVLDIHATILHLLGLNGEKLTYLHNGRDERPTINDGQVISKLLA